MATTIIGMSSTTVILNMGWTGPARGFDGFILALNCRQQNPPHFALYSSRVKVKD
uniref:Uncharacterized protein n=1 Tax=Oryza sativa subsp. japonica TaxID=39947 RepID=Q10IQ8_ORYSJ|nr:hypothetical protein LOC_Os03g33384 [Oryza sativa Japonica Group]